MANENVFYRARAAVSRMIEPQEERDKMLRTVAQLGRAYEYGPWRLPPQELARQLQEQDSWMIQDILNQMDWESLGTYAADSSAERQRAINDSVRLFKYSPLAQFSLWLWTGWGLGDEVRVIIRDNPEVQAIWDEFWEADRNKIVLGEDVIHDLSNFLLRDGNTFLVYFTGVDGKSTLRELPVSEMTAIVTDPDDGFTPLFYQRTNPVDNMQTYYPDWLAYIDDLLDTNVSIDGETQQIVDSELTKSVLTDNASSVRMDKQREATTMVVQHIAHNRKERDSLWGWPLLTCARAYMKSHKEFTESRLTVAQSVAMFVRRKQVSGGSRAVKSIAGTLQSALGRNQMSDTNAPPYAGSVEIDNEAVRTTDLPLRTGAIDAHSDNELFAWVSLLGAGLFPTSAGLDTTRWATAIEMDKAQSMLFETYKTFWSAQFTQMVRVVIGMYEKRTGKKMKPYTVQVSTDALYLSDVPGIATSVSKLLQTSLSPLVDQGIVPTKAAKKIVAALWHSVLQAMGVTDADDITNSESFEFDKITPPAVPVVPPVVSPPPMDDDEPDEED